MVEGAFEREPGLETSIIDQTAMGRIGKSEEVAESVVWLCSEKVFLRYWPIIGCGRGNDNLGIICDNQGKIPENYNEF